MAKQSAERTPVTAQLTVSPPRMLQSNMRCEL